MMKVKDLLLPDTSDTIVAPATPPFPSAIAIVRVSGKLSKEILEKLFVSSQNPAENPRKMIRGTLVSTDGEEIDDCLAVFYRSPASYTGEDMVEIFLHGNPQIVERVVAECVRLGARRAEPGEFTLRAFLNGKMTLEQAEAVDSLVRAVTSEGAKLSLKILKGEFGKILSEIRESILEVIAGVEASIDFPEDVDPDYPYERMREEVLGVLDRLRKLAEGWLKSQVLIDGAKCVIVGKPNAGKSTLFNALCGSERAIVTEIPGTTRDFIDAKISLGGIVITLYDTAGIRVTDDPVEKEGIKRALKLVNNAHCVLAVFDASLPPTDDDREVCTKITESISENFVKGIALLNKSDIAVRDEWKKFLEENLPGWDVVQVSAKRRDGIDTVEELLVKSFSFTADDVWVITPRQRECVESMLKHTEEALKFLEMKDYLGVSYSLRAILGEIDNIMGKNTSEDIIDKIFSRFCIGK